MSVKSENGIGKDDAATFEARYAEFREDTDKMDQMNVFLNELLENAQKEAGVRLDAKKAAQGRTNNSRSLFTGLRKGRMLTRARTVVIRMFEAICNCTTNGGPAQSTAAQQQQQQQERPILKKAHTLAN